jgi:6-phosphogluconolactonase
MKVRTVVALAALSCLATIIFAGLGAQGAPRAGFRSAATTGRVYTMTNAVAGNVVNAYIRAANGQLTLQTSVSTRGTGTGADLGSQGALIVSPNHKSLFVANAGSNDITAFQITVSGLKFVNKISSGGTTPISLTTNGKLLYALNSSGTTPNITGFRINANGSLSALAGATAALSGSGAGPAEVSFNRNASLLVVSEEKGNNIDTFTVGSNGLPGPALIQPSSGAGPFGFAYDNRGHLIVSEAPGSSVSSYFVNASGALSVISGSVMDFGKAACWIANTNNSGFPTQYSYTTNTGSDSISGYVIRSNGSIALLDPSGVTFQLSTGAKPLDMAMDSGSNFLYVLAQGLGSVDGFQINSDGSLAQVTSVSGLPSSAYGLAGF